MTELTTILLIVSIIAVSLSIIAIFYIIIAYRRRAITMKKVDYLVEDLTYKSESLSSTVKTIGKVANYIDAFETISKKNVTSAAKLLARNKDDIYKIGNRIMDLALGKQNIKNKSSDQKAQKSKAKKSNLKKSSIKTKKVKSKVKKKAVNNGH